jgi:hypothetical protein
MPRSIWADDSPSSSSGFALIGGFRTGSLVGWIASVVGVVLAVAAIGLVEVVMALRYRACRRLLARN